MLKTTWFSLSISNLIGKTYCIAILVLGLALMPSGVRADAIPVELRQTDEGWQLLRGGQPFFINGAGGDASLEKLAAAGANSVRTWGSDGAGKILDEAHALGLTVTVGIWLGHERHGFDYGDRRRSASSSTMPEKPCCATRTTRHCFSGVLATKWRASGTATIR